MIIFFLILFGYFIGIITKLAIAKQWKELWVVGTVTSIGVVVSGLMTVGVEFPNVGSLMLEGFLKIYRMIGIKV
ncbi:MAG TPA: hypothetical protein PL004_08340 [Bacillota bacterium]|nr:hypothetical protein [Bacillota bacterium]